MSHQAGQDFFHSKRPWSKRKDEILRQYLPPYLAKIATQRKPVLVVDGFAGRGRFKDGEPGSPLVICEAIRDARQKLPYADFTAQLVEADNELAEHLAQEVWAYRSFARVENQPFESVLRSLDLLAETHNLFLYLDPFTNSRLAWADLDRVFAKVSRATSVEVLLNFNVRAIARAGCVALNKNFKGDTTSDADGSEVADSTKETLNNALGGDWWQDPFHQAPTFPLVCQTLLDGYALRLRQRFKEVCVHEIKEKDAHAVCKYALMFGSRHSAALELMNDAMVKSRDMQAELEAPSEPVLFEMRSTSLVPNTAPLQQAIIELATSKQSRRDLIVAVIRRLFGQFARKDIRGQIEAYLKSGRLISATGKHRINDDVGVWLNR